MSFSYASIQKILVNNNPQDVLGELDFSLDLAQTSGAKNSGNTLNKLFLTQYLLRERLAQLSYADGQPLKSVRQLAADVQADQKNKQTIGQKIKNVFTQFASKQEDVTQSYDAAFERLYHFYKNHINQVRELVSYESQALQIALNGIPADKQKQLVATYFGYIKNYLDLLEVQDSEQRLYYAQDIKKSLIDDLTKIVGKSAADTFLNTVAADPKSLAAQIMTPVAKSSSSHTAEK